ncbi:MAG TPA: alpha/beta hydrolase [Sphingomicrobium sp.]|nr:alpha/beta hydrolase [Sphingomicrobium sp.]
MVVSQADLLFPRHAVGPPGPLPPNTEQWELRTAGGDVLRGVHMPPRRDPPDQRLLILGFAGNAWNSANAAALLHELYPEAHVVAFHYRGYAPSTGAPSAQALLDDAPLVHDLAVSRIRPSRTIAVGFSIGSGVAAVLASKRPVDGLILVTPFDSLTSVAEAWYPWLPVRALFRHEIDARGALKQSTVPVAIIAAGRDDIVPAERTEALRQAARNLAFSQTIEAAGHNDLYSRPEFERAMTDALAALGG